MRNLPKTWKTDLQQLWNESRLFRFLVYYDAIAVLLILVSILMVK